MKHEVENGFYSIQFMNCVIKGVKFSSDKWENVEHDVLYYAPDVYKLISDQSHYYQKYRVHYANLDAGTIVDVTKIIDANMPMDTCPDCGYHADCKCEA